MCAAGKAPAAKKAAAGSGSKPKPKPAAKKAVKPKRTGKGEKVAWDDDDDDDEPSAESSEDDASSDDDVPLVKRGKAAAKAK